MSQHGRTQTRNVGMKQTRREDGAKRNAAWQALTPTQQMKVLDTRLGVGVGAKRQRAKLVRERIATLTAAVDVIVPEEILSEVRTAEFRPEDRQMVDEKLTKKEQRERKSRKGGKK